MNRQNALRIHSALPESARVLDVGGANAPFPRADYVMDLLAFEERDRATRKLLGDAIATRFSTSTWIQLDICDRKPWPFPDRYFDYSICSHVLEDVRDPVWVCSELQRVSTAGYLETPTRILEQASGIENPRYCGFTHHRWLVEMEDGRVAFRFKSHMLHTLREAHTCAVGVRQRLNPTYEAQWMEWSDHFEATEIISLAEQDAQEDLIQFAQHARMLPALVVDHDLPLKQLIKKAIYWTRLRGGRR